MSETPSGAQDTTSSGEHGAFDLLAHGVQRQLYAMKWRELRPIQSAAIRSYMQSERDLLLMAETAAGKTEAAFLPVLSSIVEEREGSVRAIYVGPLKALINDQFARLEDLCTHTETPVHRWHGDVGDAKKKALVKKPGGVLLITPESLESLLVNRTAQLPRVFGGLRAIVIDELHAFLEGERGRHLASLLVRLKRYVGEKEPRVRMIGLSATIGDAEIGQRYLSPDEPGNVAVLRDEGESTDIMMRVHGYDARRIAAARGTAEIIGVEDFGELVNTAIAEDLSEHCGVHSNLVFANAKGEIEILADHANALRRESGLPESFLVHHGSLSKEMREFTEERMKSSAAHTAICSSTLEMGIDIGSVRLVGQIGAPWSAASLKQRMGRSGRKEGEARRLRCYADCTLEPSTADPLSLLPFELLQTIAVCELVLAGWVEPPADGELDLSTLTHQVISTIAEMGAVYAAALHGRLCMEGPFRAVTKELFVRLLRALGAADVIEQGADGKLILGLEGEALRAKRDFYAAFSTPVEYAVVAGRYPLGKLPFETLPKEGDRIVFAGRRWRVVAIDTERYEVRVEPAKRGKKPVFTSGGGGVHGRVVEEMRRVLAGDEAVRYLDAPAAEALEAARAHARAHGLAGRGALGLSDSTCVWMVWAGTAAVTARVALLESVGIDVDNRMERGKLAGIVCRCSLADLREVIERWSGEAPDLLTLAEHVQPKRRRKYDYLLPDELLDEGIASGLVWGHGA